MLENIKPNRKMPLKVLVRLRYLHQDKGVKICELIKTKDLLVIPNRSSIYIQSCLLIQ